MKRLLRACLVLPWRCLTWLRGVVANLLLLALLLGIAIALLVREPSPGLTGDNLLVLMPGGWLVEQRSIPDPFLSWQLGHDASTGESVLHELTSAIRWAAHDRHIRGMVLYPDQLEETDLAKLDSLASAIAAFRQSGKPVVAIGDRYSQTQYFLASLADRIYLNPMGDVGIEGFSVWQSYLKELLDTLAINVHVFRAGQFKSFVEPFTRNDMSAEARSNLAHWVEGQWDFYTDTVEQRRGLEAGSLDRFVAGQDRLLAEANGNAAALAVTYKLVDALATRDEAEDLVDALGEYQAETIDAEAYYQHIVQRKVTSSWFDQTPRVAVIQLNGEIMDGYQPPGFAGAETLIEQIRIARDDPQVHAIVLRIDSPGGSAFAAELIRSELAAAQADGKPVVASLSGVAASGGYWVAATANEIWASPATITGSIGVFGLVPTLEQSLDKLGIHGDGHGTSTLAGALQPDRPLDPQAARVLQQGVDFTYREFLRVVAEGRKRSTESLHPVAQGQVWTGAQAHSRGLVDHLGTLDDAVAAAARLAGITRYEPQYLEPALSPWESLLQDFSAHVLLPQPWLDTVRSLLQLPAVRELASLPSVADPRRRIQAYCRECRASLR